MDNEIVLFCSAKSSSRSLALKSPRLRGLAREVLLVGEASLSFPLTQPGPGEWVRDLSNFLGIFVPGLGVSSNTLVAWVAVELLL
jgi:hypothetical protein